MEMEIQDKGFKEAAYDFLQLLIRRDERGKKVALHVKKMQIIKIRQDKLLKELFLCKKL